MDGNVKIGGKFLLQGILWITAILIPVLWIPAIPAGKTQ
jgi:hypothetical protein